MKDQRGTMTFPWSHSMDVEQSSGFLDPNLCSLHSPLYFSYTLKPRMVEKLGSGPWGHLCCSPAGSVFASARIFWRPDRPPGDTAGVAHHLEDRGYATQGFPSVLSTGHASPSEPPGGKPRLGFLIQANFLLILIGGFAQDRNAVPGQWHFTEDHRNRVPRRRGEQI